MGRAAAIPVFTLYGETEQFPDLVHCEDISTRSAPLGWRIKAHRHAAMAQLFALEDGGVDAMVDGVAQCLNGGRFLFVPAQAVHAFDFAPGTEGYVVSFPTHVIAGIGPVGSDTIDRLSKPFIGRFDAHLQRLTRLLADTLSRASAFRAEQALGLAHALLAAVAEAGDSAPATASAPASQARLDRLGALIADHMSEAWSAADYAKALAVSTGHLSRICRAATGLGAQAYIEHAIMTEACRLLAFTQLPVAEIGYRVGFNDPSYFAKRFKTIRRKAPSAYRAQFAGRDTGHLDT
ncbi:MAG: helix-turn-helix domain-containing protein [Pseudomonadota bacterium]